MQFYKDLDDTYTLSKLTEEQMYDLYSILAFVGRSKNILEDRVTDEEYSFSSEVSELIAEFLSDEEYYRIMQED